MQYSFKKPVTILKSENTENSNKNSIDEYLVFVASEKDINWLGKYLKMEDLKSAYIKENSIKYTYKEYTIYK